MSLEIQSKKTTPPPPPTTSTMTSTTTSTKTSTTTAVAVAVDTINDNIDINVLTGQNNRYYSPIIPHIPVGQYSQLVYDTVSKMTNLTQLFFFGSPSFPNKHLKQLLFTTIPHIPHNTGSPWVQWSKMCNNRRNYIHFARIDHFKSILRTNMELL